MITLQVADREGATSAVSFEVAVAAAAPVITTVAISPAVLAGGSLTLEARASGTPPLSYQWFFEGTALNGAAAATLPLNNLQLSQAGAYSVEVRNSAGTDRKTIAQLTVNAELGITSEPADLTVIQGANASFQVTAGGTAPLSYQWSFGGTPIRGATLDTLTLANVQAAMQGGYSVEITNPAGTVASRVAALTVLVPSTLSGQLQDQVVATGSLVTFSVNASGTAPLTYQWLYNGTAIPGANSANLVLDNVQTGQSGSYQVVITNPAGETLSRAALLTVSEPVAIVSQPSDQTIVEGQSGTISVQAGGTGPFRYQWFRNGNPILGETGQTLDLKGALVAQSGRYSVEVVNAVGRIRSAEAVVTVAVAPVITQIPSDKTAVEGSTAVLTAPVSGTKPLIYQWLRDGVEIPGATGSTLNLPSV